MSLGLVLSLEAVPLLLLLSSLLSELEPVDEDPVAVAVLEPVLDPEPEPEPGEMVVVSWLMSVGAVATTVTLWAAVEADET